MYQKCIVDIDLAIEANCPKQLLKKLENRRAECSKEMPQEVKHSKPQLDYEENKNFPGLADVLQIKGNKEYGRHYIAKTHNDVGKIVLVEEPFTSTRLWDLDGHRCFNCFALGANFIACDNCTKAMFCSPKCMIDGFHEIISYEKNDSDDDHVIEYAARSVLKAIGIFLNVDDLVKFVKNVVHTKNEMQEVPSSTIDPKSMYRVFLQLNLSMGDEYTKKMFIHGYELYNYLMTMPTIKQQF